MPCCECTKRWRENKTYVNWKRGKKYNRKKPQKWNSQKLLRIMWSNKEVQHCTLMGNLKWKCMCTRKSQQSTKRCSEKDSNMEPTMKSVADKNLNASCDCVKEVHLTKNARSQITTINQKEQASKLFKEGVKKNKIKASKNDVRPYPRFS